MKRALRSLLAFGILVWLLSHVEWQKVGEVFMRVNHPFLLLGVGSVFVSFMMVSLRWQALLKGLGHETLGLGELFRYWLVGYFYSLIIPFRLSSELVRGSAVAARISRPGDVPVSVFLDRLIGLLTLVTGGVLLSIFLRPKFLQGHSFFEAITLLFCVVFGILFFVRSGLLERFSWLREGLRCLRERPENVFLALCFSCMAHLSVIFSNLFFAESLQLKLSFWVIAFATCWAGTFALVPVSIAGISLREGAYAFLLMQFGVVQGEAVVLTALAVAALYAAGLLGGTMELITSFPYAKRD